MKPLRHIKKPQPQKLSRGGVVVRHYDGGGAVDQGNGTTQVTLANGMGFGTPTAAWDAATGTAPTAAPAANPNDPTLAGPTTNGVSVANTGANQGLSGLLGTSNNFTAGYAPVQAGTNAAQLNNTYQNAQNALQNQVNLSNQFNQGATQGLGTQNSLTGQLEGVVSGTGPNAAQTQLAQNTGVNIANQAALQAGQRGGSQNAGLLARQIGQQGASTQQQAVGQAGTQQAQQQLAAQQALQGLAASQTGQAATAAGALNTAAQGQEGILQNANANLNTVNAGQQANVNATNAGVAAGNQQQGNNLLNDVGKGLSSALSFVGGLYKGGGVSPGPHASHVANYLFAGGESNGVDALVSPGEKYLSPDDVKKVMEEGINPRKLGKLVPGKPKVKGDSIKNDTVPVTLEEGGVVIPRHLMKPGVKPEKVELFIHRSVARKHLPLKGSK